MLRAILKKELIELFSGPRYWAGFAATVVMAAGIWWTGGEDYRLRLQRWERQSQGYERDLAKARTYSQFQPTVVRPPEPLGLLEPGFDARLGAEVRIALPRIPYEAKAPFQGNEFLGSAPEIGLGSLVGLVLGFFSLLLTFDSFARERESGSLRLLEAEGLSPERILLAKYLATLFALSLPLAVAMAPAVERLAARAGGLTGDLLLRTGFLFLAGLGYLSCITLWGLVLSLRAPNRAAALTQAVEAWLVTVLILPVVAGNGIQAWIRPHRPELDADIARLEERRDAAIRKLPCWSTTFTGHSPIQLEAGGSRQILIRMGSSRYYDRAGRCYAEAARITRAHAEEIALLERGREAVWRRGERALASLAVASPRLLLDRLIGDWTGTASRDHQRFLAACRRYRRALVGHFEREGSFRSWRWFTDDPPGGAHPWTLFFGRAPEEVGAEEAAQLAQRLEEPAVKEALSAKIHEWETDPSRFLDRERLPAYSPPRVTLAARLRGTLGAGLALFALHAAALGLAWRRLRPGEGR